MGIGNQNKALKVESYLKLYICLAAYNPIKTEDNFQTCGSITLDQYKDYFWDNYNQLLTLFLLFLGSLCIILRFNGT